MLMQISGVSRFTNPLTPKDSSKFKILLLKIFSLTQNTSEILAATMDGG